MANRFITLFCMVIVCTLLSSCGMLANPGTIDHAVIEIGSSEKFTDDEIRSAMDCVLAEFRHFSGCDLEKLWYDEEKSDAFFTDGSDDNHIMLLSNFTTDEMAGDEGFETNSTYTHWTWQLERKDPQSKWKLKDWGYG